MQKRESSLLEVVPEKMAPLESSGVVWDISARTYTYIGVCKPQRLV